MPSKSRDRACLYQIHWREPGASRFRVRSGGTPAHSKPQGAARPSFVLTPQGIPSRYQAPTFIAARRTISGAASPVTTSTPHRRRKIAFRLPGLRGRMEWYPVHAREPHPTLGGVAAGEHLT